MCNEIVPNRAAMRIAMTEAEVGANSGDELRWRRAEWAEVLVQIGSCPRDVERWKALLLLLGTWQLGANCRRRPLVHRAPMGKDLLAREPDAHIILEQDLFLQNIKCVRHGSRRTIRFDF